MNPPARKVLSVLTVWAASAALTACSGGTGTSTPTTGPTEQASIPVLPSVANGQGAIKDLSGLTCDRDAAGVWSAKGTLTNSAGLDQVYVVSFAVAKTEGGTVRARVVDTIPLKAGESKPVEKSAFFTSAEQGLQCVPSVVRGKAAK